MQPKCATVDPRAVAFDHARLLERAYPPCDCGCRQRNALGQLNLGLPAIVGKGAEYGLIERI